MKHCRSWHGCPGIRRPSLQCKEMDYQGLHFWSVLVCTNMDDTFSSPGSRLMIFQGDFYCKKASTVVLRPEVCADLWKCHMILLLSRRGMGLTTQKASFPIVHICERLGNLQEHIRQGHGCAAPRHSIEFPTSIPNFSATTAFYWPASHVRVELCRQQGSKAHSISW